MFSFQGTELWINSRFQFLIIKNWNPASIWENKWWAKVDSNHRPHDYQSCALASWAIGPFFSDIRTSVFRPSPRARGGDEENRTPDPLLARQVLSQLSYTPIVYRVLPSYALFEDSFLSEEILKIKQCTSIARLRILLAAFLFKCLPHFFSNSFTRSLTDRKSVV